MNGSSMSCPHCQGPLPENYLNTADLAACPGCGERINVQVYPALFQRREEGRIGESLHGEGEASCYYHPEKRAAVTCEACGRFLCSLCDVDLENKHLCPPCLESGSKKGKLANLENRRTLYDSAALSLSLLPLLIWPLTPVTGPASVALAIYSLGKTSSVIPRTRIRSYLAILFGGLETAGWIFLLVKWIFTG